ncbi:MAG: hypothetical protein IPK33_04745 [Gemmatimonadetes bacterium]|nr:hypothetical protein [Gemmatimonadota bacterium]
MTSTTFGSPAPRTATPDLTLFFPQDSTALAPRRAHEIITRTPSPSSTSTSGETSTLLKSEGGGLS